jgi:hypothetical protein
MVKMNVIDYIMITCNLKKNDRLQITSDYMKKCNRLQLITITITPCLWGKPSILLMTNNWLSHWSVFQLYSPRERIKQYFKTQMTEGGVVQQGKWLDHTIERPPLLSTIWDVLTSYTTQYPDDQYYLILTKMQNKIIIRKLSILMIVMLSRYITPEQYG